MEKYRWQTEGASVTAGIWAIGFHDAATLTEHWDGTSWKIVHSPNPGNLENRLSGVTALSDGTAAAVGFQEDSTTGFTPLILQDAASAPKTWKTTAALAATLPDLLETAPATPDGTATADSTKKSLGTVRDSRSFGLRSRRPIMRFHFGRLVRAGRSTSHASHERPVVEVLEDRHLPSGVFAGHLPISHYHPATLQAAASPAAAQTVVALSVNVTIAAGQGLPAFTVRVGAHASGPADALAGSGFDSPFPGNPTGTPSYCRFDTLTGSLVGNQLTLTGTVGFSTDPSLVGTPATITANVSTGAITFNFGGVVLTGTGSVVVAHQ